MKAGRPRRDVKSTGGVARGNDRGVDLGEQIQGGGQLLGVELLTCDVMPCLATSPTAATFALVHPVDGKTQPVEMFGDVTMEEIVGHAMNKEHRGAGEELGVWLSHFGGRFSWQVANQRENGRGFAIWVFVGQGYRRYTEIIGPLRRDRAGLVGGKRQLFVTRDGLNLLGNAHA